VTVTVETFLLTFS